MTLSFEVGALPACVEATMFIRVIDGTWPVGFHGQFAARTASSRNEITLIQFNGDGVTTRGGSDGNMIHLRHVVSVETLGELVVSFKAWKGDTEEMEGHVKFNPEMSGRSCGYLKVVGPCNVGGTCRLVAYAACA